VCTGDMINVPVKTEHSGVSVGRVVSTFIDSRGCLQCVLEVDERSVAGSLVGGFVRDHIAADLSLGYTVDVQHTGDDRLRAGDKRVLEVSLVRKGAREGCHISAYQDAGKPVVYTETSTRDPWACFRMPDAPGPRA
jgi:hypothetical protein